jgi:hypothetical protein
MNRSAWSGFVLVLLVSGAWGQELQVVGTIQTSMTRFAFIDSIQTSEHVK